MKTTDETMPIIEIVLGAYNGEDFIEEQLESISAQTYRNWKLLIADDGSSDATKEIIKNFMRSNPSLNISLIDGPGNGFVFNFLYLLTLTEADYICFCDQDDIWDENKLSKSLSSIPGPNEVALYCGRTVLINEKNDAIGFAPLHQKKPTFANALVQSIAGGNTMMLTRSARNLVVNSSQNCRSIISHDWWSYQIITANGGKVVYDPEPMVFYRQHSRNLIGSNNGIRSKIARFNKMLVGQVSDWNVTVIDNLNSNLPLITEQNKEILSKFQLARSSFLIKRIILMKQTNIYRQTILGNFGLWLAIILNRV